MVKVILFQLFSKQQVLSSELEPVDTAVAAEDVFLVATKEGSVQAYSAGEECVLLHQFFIAGATVLSIAYSAHYDAVLTLERNSDKTGTAVVRAYFNWRQGVASTAPTLRPLQSSEAGDEIDEPQPDAAKLAKAVWYYRFPNLSNATAIAVCPMSGNVAVSLGKTIGLFVPSLPATPYSVGAAAPTVLLNGSPFTCLIEIDSYFNVTMLSLCLDTIAYACEHEMQVIRIELQRDVVRAHGQVQLQAAANMLRESFSYSSTQTPMDYFDSDKPPALDPVEDTYLVNCSFDPSGALVSQQSHMTLIAPSVPAGGKAAPSASNSNSTLQVMGPLRWTDNTVRLLPVEQQPLSPVPSFSTASVKRAQTEGEAESLITTQLSNAAAAAAAAAASAPGELTALYIHSVTLLLHRRVSGVNSLRKVLVRPERRSLKSTTIRPPRDGDLPTTSASPLMRGCEHASRLQLFYSDAQRGMLYDAATVQLLSRYNYTAPILDVTLCNYFLYAVSSQGLETWTVRNSLTRDVQTDPLLADIDFPDTCLIGMQQFLSLKAVVATDSFLVILSKHFFEKSTSRRARRSSKATQETDGFLAISPPRASESSWSSSAANLFSSSPSTPRTGSGRAGSGNNMVQSPPQGGFRGLTSLTSLVLGEERDVADPGTHAYLPSPADLSSSSSWALYVLSPVPLLALCDEMARGASNHRETNPGVQYLLLLEAHFLLQTKLLLLETKTDVAMPDAAARPGPADDNVPWTSSFRGSNRRLAGGVVPETDPVKAIAYSLEENNVQRLLSGAAAAIGELFLNQSQFDPAARFFVASHRSLREVVELLNVPISTSALMAAAETDPAQAMSPATARSVLARQFSDNGEALPRARGLLAYLERVLFNSAYADALDEDAAVANRVLQFFYDYQEYRLCDVILDSCLDQYDENLAVHLLEGLKQQRIMVQAGASGMVQPNVSLYSRPQEAFALALLYLDIGKIGLARQRLIEIDRGDLVALTVSYGHLLSPRRPTPEPASSRPSLSLGQLLRLAMPSVLLDALRRIGPKLPVQTSVQLLKFRSDDFKELRAQGDDGTEEMALLRPFLESLLHESDTELSASEHELVMTELVGLYITLITRAAALTSTTTTSAAERYMPSSSSSATPPPMPMSASANVGVSNVSATANGQSAASAVPTTTTTTTTTTTAPAAAPAVTTPVSPQRGSSKSSRPIFFASPPATLNSPLSDSIGFRGGWTSYRHRWIDLICDNVDNGDGKPGSASSPFIAPPAPEDTPPTAAWFFIIQLQGLVSLHIASTEAARHGNLRAVAESVLNCCSSMNMNNLNARDRTGMLVVRLMCLPASGHLREAVEQLAAVPTVTTEALVAYGRSTCAQLGEWQTFLDVLLRLRETAPKEERRLRQVCRETYSALLDHLTGQIDPTDLLNLLPENGTLSFFLPIVEAALHRYAAVAVHDAMKSEAARIAAAELRGDT